MPAALKPVLTRQMEVYAGFLEYTDYHVGRLVDTLKKMNLLDDTLIYYINGDNGASAEGTINGTFNEIISLNGAAAVETPEFMMERLDKLGGRSLTTTIQWAGRMRWIRLTSGPSRLRRILGAHATGRSCTGRRASRRRGRSAASSVT